MLDRITLTLLNISYQSASLSRSRSGQVRIGVRAIFGLWLGLSLGLTLTITIILTLSESAVLQAGTNCSVSAIRSILHRLGQVCRHRVFGCNPVLWLVTYPCD